MPSDMQWYIPDHVMFVREYGVLRMEDVTASNAKARSYLEQCPGTLHFIFDHTGLDAAPKSLSALVGALDTFRHPKLGWFLIFGHGSNRYFRALAQFITKIFGTNMREVDSLEQALALLIEIDPSLEPAILEKERDRLAQICDTA